MLPRIGPCRRITTLTLFLATSVFLIFFTALTYNALGRPSFHVPYASSSVDASNALLHDFVLPPIPVDCSIHVGPPLRPSEDGKATLLAAKDLLCRPVDKTARGIPKLFHQSWKNDEVPAKFKTWSEGCRELHPDWEYVLWTDDDNLALVQTYFPWLEDTYRGLAGPIYRADFVRNLYMYMYGGYVFPHHAPAPSLCANLTILQSLRRSRYDLSTKHRRRPRTVSHPLYRRRRCYGRPRERSEFPPRHRSSGYAGRRL